MLSHLLPVSSRCLPMLSRYSHCSSLHTLTFSTATPPPGILHAKLTTTHPVHITCLDPHSTSWKTSTITLTTDSSPDFFSSHPPLVCDGSLSPCHLLVSPKLPPHTGVHLALPGRFSLNVETIGPIHISGTFEGNISLKSRSSITLSRIKASNISVSGESIYAEVLQGFLKLNASGDVQAKRVQGGEIEIQGGGDVRLGAVYGDNVIVNGMRNVNVDVIDVRKIGNVKGKEVDIGDVETKDMGKMKVEGERVDIDGVWGRNVEIVGDWVEMGMTDGGVRIKDGAKVWTEEGLEKEWAGKEIKIGEGENVVVEGKEEVRVKKADWGARVLRKR